MKFEVGKTYWYSYFTKQGYTRFEVLARTEKNVKILKNGREKAQWKRITVLANGKEILYPEGHFPRCPMASVDQIDGRFEADRVDR